MLIFIRVTEIMMKELTIEAKTDNLDSVIDFINAQLEELECSMKIRMQIDIAVEELFVNIASYAYQDDDRPGTATVIFDTEKDENVTAMITFIDCGIPFNPLEREDPDTSLSADKRPIGGLGIFISKKNMDSMRYEYKEGKNILTICKQLF